MSEGPDREEKTEEPSEKRLSEARSKGNTPNSRDAAIVLNIVAIWLVLTYLFSGASVRVAAALRPFIEDPARWELRTAGDFGQLLTYIAIYLGGALLPVVGLIALSGLLGAVPQSGGLILTRLSPDFSRLSLLKGLSRTFGQSNLTNGAKTLFRVGLLGVVTLSSLRSLSTTFLTGDGLAATALAQTIVGVMANLVRDILMVVIIIAVADIFLVRYFWRRDLKMSKQEVKDEQKEAEGDKALKHRMRLLARQRLKRRMIAAVPKATVVIANPTHFAVALRYVKEEGGAPKVVAKGQDSLALRIRAIAEQNNVPVIENKPLARALHEAVPVDAFIPPEFYKAVAEIISLLMKRRR